MCILPSLNSLTAVSLAQALKVSHHHYYHHTTANPQHVRFLISVVSIGDSSCTMCSDLATSDAGPGKAPMGKPDWAHVFLTVLDTLPIHSQEEQKQAATALRAAGAAVMSRHSTALRKAGVAQWELRLCVPHGMPAWRIVVSSPTGTLVATLLSLLLQEAMVFSPSITTILCLGPGCVHLVACLHGKL